MPYTYYMIIYLGADHRGFALKEQLKEVLKNEGYELMDVGAVALTPDDDYADYAQLAAAKVSEAPSSVRAILLCSSGVGMDIVANKFTGVRSVLAISPDHAYAARHDDDVSVLSIAVDFVPADTVMKIVTVFLTTPFGGDERYERRLEKIAVIEGNR